MTCCSSYCKVLTALVPLQGPHRTTTKLVCVHTSITGNGSSVIYKIFGCGFGGWTLLNSKSLVNPDLPANDRSGPSPTSSHAIYTPGPSCSSPTPWFLLLLFLPCSLFPELSKLLPKSLSGWLLFIIHDSAQMSPHPRSLPWPSYPPRPHPHSWFYLLFGSYQLKWTCSFIYLLLITYIFSLKVKSGENWVKFIGLLCIIVCVYCICILCITMDFFK